MVVDEIILKSEIAMGAFWRSLKLSSVGGTNVNILVYHGKNCKTTLKLFAFFHSVKNCKKSSGDQLIAKLQTQIKIKVIVSPKLKPKKIN